MTNSTVSRRRLMKMGFGAATAAGLISVPGTGAGMTDSDSSPFSRNGKDSKAGEHAAASFQHAYSFLGAMMDAYAQGSTLRLVQSYTDQQGLSSTAFTYDNAQAIN